MAKYLLSTDLLIQHLGEGAASTALASRKMRDLAVCALSFEWIIAEAEKKLEPQDRVKWRTNVTRFRETLLRNGGEVLAISEQALEQWGRLTILTLVHKGVQMSTEERLVAATAAASGYIYLTQARDWNKAIEAGLEVAIEEI